MPLPKLLLLHGALSSSLQFDLMKKNLSEDFDFITLDFPGHGGSEIPAEAFSISLFAEYVSSFLEGKNISKADVFGYSMGGYAALWMARNFPDSIGKIFTVGTKLNWNEVSAARETSMLDPEKMEKKIPAFVNMLQQLHSQQDWKQVVRKTAGMMLDLGQHHLTGEDFKAIRNKVMITVGDNDNMVSVEESRHAAELLPNGSFGILHETAHPFEKINLEMLTPLVRAFFKK